ncbi:TatD family hydrolase [Candidatus Bathyarchaeota archaeon]|nr:TatD family hydrolase [Candidatus Bathyarchaeota archaeon]
MRLVDTHAHVDELIDLDGAIERARIKGVTAVVAVGASLAVNTKILEIAQEHPDFIYPAIGIHPAEAEAASDEALRFIDENADACAAIGEIGLDYSYRVDKDLQKAVFKKMLEVAERHDKPVSLHSRYAWDEVLSCVLDKEIRRGVFHWYTGPLETLEKILDCGYLVSATPAIEYSMKHREAIERAAVESILLETDTPVKYRGVTSEPSHVIRVADAVAEIKNLTVKRLAEITTSNACKLFGLQF